MEESRIIEGIEGIVKEIFERDATGHDYYHMKRVAFQAKEIAIAEGADPFLSEAAGWLHDIGDRKLFTDSGSAWEMVTAKLTELGLSKSFIQEIRKIVADVSFSKGKLPDSLEGRIVQDADRLDAIGAIGIARTFAFGGAKNQLIHTNTKENTSIKHFYDKLLKLKGMMNTEEAKRKAIHRHLFLKQYLAEFLAEWEVGEQHD
ncbi:HD domain-containing protein [Thalassobacillus pellis]|uniref:HD domain-containing protein n=1 Tax=Thalassobacillus pellis TaxID=748008 RepID=UPI0019620C7F|nr:HD domain-containing protein [Thalassobacillus pellis]MBM7552525.1 uncharacterized protein [Thalassobacillus pellis]